MQVRMSRRQKPADDDDSDGGEQWTVAGYRGAAASGGSSCSGQAAAAREAPGGLQWHLRERQPAVEDHAEAGRPTMGSRGAAAGSESSIVERPRAVGKELDAKEGRRQTRRVVAEES